MNIITLLLPFLCAAHASSNVHADNRFDFILQLYAPEDIREKIVGRAKVETGGEVGELTWEGNRQSGKDQGTCFDKEGKMQVGMADCEYGLKSFPMFKLRFTDSNDYTLEEPRPLDITIDGEVIMRCHVTAIERGWRGWVLGRGLVQNWNGDVAPVDIVCQNSTTVV